MIRCNSFGWSLAFAAIAAAGATAWLVMAGPIVGGGNALRLFLVGVTALYASGLAPTTRAAIATAILTGLGGLGLAAIAPGLRELTIGLAVLLGIGRSGFLHQARAARAVITEAVLIVGGLLFAASLGGSSLRAVALSVWAFFLVQSFYFLLPGTRPRPHSTDCGDPFDAAHRRALALLDARVT
jgi:hypothetical protein